MQARTQGIYPTAALAAALCLLGAAGHAEAQQRAGSEGFALDRFQPAPAGDRMFGVQSAYTAGDTSPHIMILGDYAQDPLVLRTEDGNEDAGAVVGNQLLLHLSASLSLWSRVTVSADLPLALQSGDGGAASGAVLAGPSSSALGDLRLGARATLFGGYHDPLQLAIAGYVWVPTGSPEAYSGDGSLRGSPQLVLGGNADRVVWSIAAGPEFRAKKPFANVEQGMMVHWGAGLGMLLDDERRLQIGPEITGDVTISDLQQRTINVEALLGGRYRVASDFEAGLGLGPGLSAGVGTPSFRAVAMIAYSPEVKPPVHDRDGDGIHDPDDACPDVPGVGSADRAKNGCPPPPRDTDRDGIVDAVDACPDVAGVADPDPKKNGCPPPKDTDGDGFVDPVDACPDVAGVADPDPKKNGCPPPDGDGDKVPDPSDVCPDIPGLVTTDPATNGCPGDTDGDGIRDDKDACPLEKGKADVDPKQNGCPVAVRVTETEIVILQQVQFDTGKATIRPVSNELLDEVAGVLKDHPEIVKLEVQGHTDDRGARLFNVRLSQSRAESVVKALVERGIGPERMQAKGYGPDVPIAENRTEAGRQKNRRVQFNILEKAKKQQ
ncbi:porin [Sorangium cellulosum]|uniref:Porin n=1 Tax=Sorangium cellulosum TaxID=56 RepID=A0A2L0EHF3_SORCE|nr:OmpA family protein [Sorangium cellulosum]AUX38713.1 porin [Sorangium cellulosum]